MALIFTRIRPVLLANISKSVLTRSFSSVLLEQRRRCVFAGSNGVQIAGCLSFCTDGKDLKKQPRPKTVPKPLVTLLGPEKNTMNVMLLEEAERIAKRRNLKLEKVSDPDGKSHRATYRLLSHGSSFQSHTYGTETKVINKQLDHKEKQMAMNAKIGFHDLESKIKQAIKWTEKQAETRVTITGDEDGTEKVFQTFVKGLASTGARFLQKRFKGGNLKFTIAPSKESAKRADSSIEDNIKTAE
ncbi:uncharacterized protein LOC132203548 [Neocloeon triangulifer]|uniref:uncharacterized protein LOC132203548 n=1 Tax=Neocloeon triangulifer TaxID=2078957 RepID=UPI00286F61E6|nr:uncharacterized protein LOC132203548 [Neocloeon triangulifer]